MVGGMSSQKQERLLSLRPQIVVATPGRLWKMMKEVRISVRAWLANPSIAFARKRILTCVPWVSWSI